MVLLDKMWDDVVAGPQPEHIDVGEGSSSVNKFQRSLTMPATPGTPSTPVTPTTPVSARSNVWRSVFHPGSNLATRNIGAQVFDKPQPNTPTVYDWCYHGAWE
ncbi:hypothetical protein DKX38_005582 [Salix brachista]|uniref:Uncharacterized protein n=1 Tax=Salix brachista TaxID=2182728 RepID=A0A5N5MZU1_9ROSI|nr:hypothetical protein DKX38_005582 [Salix brachista]